MESVNGFLPVGEVAAFGTHKRGLNVEEIADLYMRKVINVADTTAPALKEQARIFKLNFRALLMAAMHQAIKSDRTTLYNQLKDAGNAEIAELILKI